MNTKLKKACNLFFLLSLALGLISPQAQAQNQVINATLLKGVTRLRGTGPIVGSSVYTFNLTLPAETASVYFDVEAPIGSGFTYAISFFTLPEETANMQSIPGGIWFCSKQTNGSTTNPPIASSTLTGQVITSGVADTYSCPAPPHNKLQVVVTIAAGGTVTGSFYAIVGGTGAAAYGNRPALDPCADPANVKETFPVNTAVAVIIKAGSTGLKIYVCGFSFTISGSATATANLSQGTGAVCATGLTALTGNYLGGTLPVLSMSAGGGYTAVNTTASQNLCVIPGGATPSIQGYISLVQM